MVAVDVAVAASVVAAAWVAVTDVSVAALLLIFLLMPLVRFSRLFSILSRRLSVC